MVGGEIAVRGAEVALQLDCVVCRPSDRSRQQERGGCRQIRANIPNARRATVTGPPGNPDIGQLRARTGRPFRKLDRPHRVTSRGTASGWTRGSSRRRLTARARRQVADAVIEPICDARSALRTRWPFARLLSSAIRQMDLHAVFLHLQFQPNEPLSRQRYDV